MPLWAPQKLAATTTQSSTSVLKIKLGNIVVMSLQNEFTHHMSDGLSGTDLEVQKLISLPMEVFGERLPYVPHLSSSLEALNPIHARSLCKIKEVNLKREIKKQFYFNAGCSFLTRIYVGFKRNNHYQNLWKLMPDNLVTERNHCLDKNERGWGGRLP